MLPTTLVLMLTNKCNFLCDHCSVCSGPELHDVLSEKFIKKAIDEAYYIPSIRVVAFTGGEVTLYPERLKKAIAYAHHKGFLTRIVTNAWWASTAEKAKKWCAELKTCGLNEMNISFDDFHVSYLRQFGGEKNIENAVQAAKAAGINLLIGMVLTSDAKINGQYLKKNIDEDLDCFEGAIAPFGRARELLPYDLFPTDENKAMCDDAGKSLVVLPTGKVAFCCGHAIFSQAEDLFILDDLRNGRSLADILELMHKNMLIWFIYLKGPLALFHELGIKEEIKNSCEACYYLGTKYKKELLGLARSKKEIFQKLKNKYKKELS